MIKSYKKKSDNNRPVQFDDGAILSDPNRILSGPRWAKYCPSLLEEVTTEDPAKLITEDLPNSTPQPPVIDEIPAEAQITEAIPEYLTEDEPAPVASVIKIARTKANKKN